MYVEQIMTKDVVAVTVDTAVPELERLMREKRIRHLPVIKSNGTLAGIVSHRDLQRVAPSPASTLSQGEATYLLAKLLAEEIMHKEVVTCAPTTLVEEAGKLMRRQKVGSLPVVDNGKLVGIVTGMDLVDFFLEITGSYQEDSARIAVHLKDERGRLAELLTAINQLGGSTVSVITTTHPDQAGKRTAIVRFRADDPDQIIKTLHDKEYVLLSEDLPKG
ncbi:MAG: CBS domain-containing protein [Proteobacteria bacterium]|nr:MAG: CBS domain-containing protein [Pseudomonadota bacterium]QKK10594.1 MAG: CBS domain-containing protein [Pseudomonadota bacterium]